MPRPLLEETVVGALRDCILSTDNVDYLVEAALAAIDQELGSHSAEADRIRVKDIDAALDNLTNLAARVGNVDVIAAKFRTLDAERAQLKACLETAPRLPDPGHFRASVLEHALRLRETFDGAPEEGRAALRALLGDRRMTVAADHEHGFRVEGLFGVPTWPGGSGPQTYRPPAT